MAALAAAEQIGKGDRQHRGLRMAQAVNIAAFGHLPVHGLPKAQQLLSGHWAGPVYLLLVFLQPLGQPTVAQLARRVFDDLPHVKPFGPLVRWLERTVPVY